VAELRSLVQHQPGAAALRELAPHAQQLHERHAVEDIARVRARVHRLHTCGSGVWSGCVNVSASPQSSLSACRSPASWGPSPFAPRLAASRSAFFNTLPAADMGRASAKAMLRGHL